MVVCKKDFENYKKFLEKKQEQKRKDVILGLFKEHGVDNNFIEFHNTFSSHLNELIKNGKEKLAFSHFIQSFPSCLPNRSHLRKLFEQFKNF